MTEKKWRKVIAAILIVLVLIPCGILFYESVLSSDDGKVEFYYMTTEGMMKPLKKEAVEGNREEMLLQTLQALQEGPKTDGVIASIPQNLEFLGVALVNDIAIVDVSSEYYQMSDTEEIICRSSLVWTLTSLDFVEGISITIEGNPLLNSDGTEYGTLNRKNVIIDGDISAETTEYAILKLYFANKEGTDLSVEERVVEVNTNQAREKTILEQLIAGPEEKGHTRTIPAETKIRDITTTGDGTCYVNLSTDFVTKHIGGEKEELLTIYSIVNSLCELDTIEKVQFLIEGEKLDQYKGNLDFKKPFEAVGSIKKAEMQ